MRGLRRKSARSAAREDTVSRCVRVPGSARRTAERTRGACKRAGAELGVLLGLPPSTWTAAGAWTAAGTWAAAGAWAARYPFGRT